VRQVEANGEKRDGAFPESAQAMRDFAPVLAFMRPYTPDVVGWFDDFSHSGIYDALGASSRVGIHASAFALLNGQLSPVPPELRDEAFSAGATINQRNRCPGAADQEAEDGSNPWRPNPEFNCDPSQVLSGR
jgi:phospholipid/cholesterol/gamma-HCH transport system substrate-binding protein